MTTTAEPPHGRLGAVGVQRLVSLLDHLPDGLLVLDEAWDILWVNESGAALGGARRDELIGRNLWEAFPEAAGTVLEQEYRRAVAERREICFETHYEPLDAWFELRAIPFPLGLVVSYRRIDERKAAEAELERLVAAQREAAELGDALLRVTTRLASATTLPELIGVATDGFRAVGGHGGAIGFIAEADRFEVVQLHNVDADVAKRWTGRFPLSMDIPITNAARSGVPQLLGSRAELDAAYPHLQAEWSEPTNALAALPLVLGDRTTGALVVTFQTPQEFPDDRVDFMLTVAGVCAQALERGRMFARQQETALTLQRSLLPRIDARSTDLEAAARYLPGAAGTTVGGDWYDVINLGSDRTALVVGDVMGRGVRAAALMGQVRSAIRAFARLDLPPGEVLSLLDTLVTDISAEMGQDAIVTCLYAVHDPAEHALVAASAGHPQPVMARPGELAALLPVTPGPVLGTGDAMYAETRLAFPPGAVLALYTDGLVEERSRPVTAGQSELLTALSAAEGDLEVLCDRVLRALGHVTDGGEAQADDDVALLLLRTLGTVSPPVPWVDLEASEPRQARDVVRDALVEWDRADLVDDAMLLASELVTNAVMHGRRPVQLRVRAKDEGVFLEVRDESTVLPRRRSADVDAEGGRGLNMVALLARRWGWRNEGQGKVVWAQLAAER